ncbi:MAG: hypothetical protein ABIR63_03820 [Sphingomicrobium sp.]
MRSSFLAFAAVAAVAAAGLSASATASSYSASLATPATARIIGRDIVWNCGPAACQGATDNGRPVVLCQSLAKRVGRIESFTIDGRALSAARLAECNTLSKGGAK